MSRFALLREQGTCSLTYTKIIEIPLCERWVPVRGGCPETWGTYVLDMVLPCLPAGQYPCPRTRYSTYRVKPMPQCLPIPQVINTRVRGMFRRRYYRPRTAALTRKKTFVFHCGDDLAGADSDYVAETQIALLRLLRARGTSEWPTFGRAM